jgi:signal transduction histidine kinase
MTLLSNIDEKKKSYHLKKFILNDTIISCCSFYQEDFNKINIKINLSLNENVLINGNEQLVWEMLSCILDNCKKYATSYVNISLSKYKRKYILLISNDSTFVKDGNLDICFEKFYRLDESHNSSIEGSGIGLSIVKEIATFHHFKISAYGLKGTFNIKIIFHNKFNNG